MGFLRDEEIRRLPEPGLSRYRPGVRPDVAPRQYETFSGHDAFVTIGEHIGRPDCAVRRGIEWIKTNNRWSSTSGCSRTDSARSMDRLQWGAGAAPLHQWRISHDIRATGTRVRRPAPPPSLAIASRSRWTFIPLMRRTWRCCGSRLVADVPRRAAGDPWCYREHLPLGAEVMIAKG